MKQSMPNFTTGSWSKAVIPVQHHFVRHSRNRGVSEAPDFPQLTTHALIEATGGNIDVLRLDFHLPATVLSGPFGCVPEKRDPHSPIRRQRAKVPKDRKVMPGFEHHHPAGGERHHRRTDRSFAIHRQEEAPVGHIEKSWPVGGDFPVRVIILDIRPLHRDLAQKYPAQGCRLPI